MINRPKLTRVGRSIAIVEIATIARETEHRGKPTTSVKRTVTCLRSASMAHSPARCSTKIYRQWCLRSHQRYNKSSSSKPLASRYARVERGDVFPKNEPRPGIRAVKARPIPGVRAGRHENPRSIPRNARYRRGQSTGEEPLDGLPPTLAAATRPTPPAAICELHGGPMHSPHDCRRPNLPPRAVLTACQINNSARP